VADKPREQTLKEADPKGSGKADQDLGKGTAKGLEGRTGNLPGPPTKANSYYTRDLQLK